MARVELTHAAVEDLERLIRTHSLPADTKDRVRRSLRSLESFPLIGGPLDGRWEGFRFLLGPWRWMLIVYEYFEDENRVVVATIQDGRSSRAATSDQEADLSEADSAASPSRRRSKTARSQRRVRVL